jgi:hypothetical protein
MSIVNVSGFCFRLDVYLSPSFFTTLSSTVPLLFNAELQILDAGVNNIQVHNFGMEGVVVLHSAFFYCLSDALI